MFCGERGEMKLDITRKCHVHNILNAKIQTTWIVDIKQSFLKIYFNVLILKKWFWQNIAD